MMATAQDKTHNAILNLAREREERRRQAEDAKKRRAAEARDLMEKGKFGDSDFVSMIEKFRATSDIESSSQPYLPQDGKINVAVRKRPISEREQSLLDHDSVTCANPRVVVHHCKLKVDGITKNLENTQFEFDYAFGEDATNDQVYQSTCLPLVEWVVLKNGKSTVFAYGQTGSGKTYTMEGLQQRVARDIFRLARSRGTRDSIVRVKCSNFELYGAQCLDLLNDRRVCAVREDGQGEIHVDGLHEEEAADEDDFFSILQRGAAERTTRSTEMNADSSRSHAIFQVSLSTGGKLSLIDLAGSERGQDSKNHDQTRRVESAAINKSLLALKECIRALDPASGCAHVPYRGSKLTMVLKDSFAENSRTLMISCVSPAASSSDHTLNTLRYADRVKAKGAGSSSAPIVTQMLQPKSPGPRRSGVLTSKNVSSSQANSLANSTSTFNRPKSPGPLGSAKAAKSSIVPSPHKRIRYPVSARTNKSNVSNVSVENLNISGVSLKSARSASGSMNSSPVNEDDEEFFVGMEEENQVPYEGAVARRPSAEVPRKKDDERVNQEFVPVSVHALVDEEESLLMAYSQGVQQNFRTITEESTLLNEIDSMVDYDIEEYVEKLRGLLEQKLKTMEDLHTQLLTFQQHLKEEGQYVMGTGK